MPRRSPRDNVRFVQLTLSPNEWQRMRHALIDRREHATEYVRGLILADLDRKEGRKQAATLRA